MRAKFTINNILVGSMLVVSPGSSKALYAVA